MANIFIYLNNLLMVSGIISTIGCVSWCISQYCLDSDLSLVDHKTFGDEDNYLPPSFSLCFGNPFIEEKLNEYGLNITISEYKNFLYGNQFDIEKTKIDFDKVTKNLEDYVEMYIVFWQNGSSETFTNLNLMPSYLKKPYLAYTGIQFGMFHKCYTIDIPLDSLYIELNIRQQIFPKSIRPSAMGFAVLVHYPYQLLMAYDSVKNDWPNRKMKSNTPYSMIFKVKVVEAIIRRNTRPKPCNENWRGDDMDIFEKLMSINKCKAPYHTWNTKYPICDDKNKMAEANVYFDDRDKLSPPCQHIEKVLYDYQEYEFEDIFGTEGLSDIDLYDKDTYAMMNKNDTFSIKFALMSKKFKLITHKRAYDLQTLIGNCGGYIGLILGNTAVNNLVDNRI